MRMLLRFSSREGEVGTVERYRDPPPPFWDLTSGWGCLCAGDPFCTEGEAGRTGRGEDRRNVCAEPERASAALLVGVRVRT